MREIEWEFSRLEGDQIARRALRLTPRAKALVAELGTPCAPADLQKFRFAAARRDLGRNAPGRSWAGRGRLTRGSAGATAPLQICAAPGGSGRRPGWWRVRRAFVSLRGAFFTRAAATAAASVVRSPGRLFRAQLSPLLLKLLLLLGADQRLHGEGVCLEA